MSRTGSTGVIAVRYVPTVASATLATVTAAEITAGIDLTPALMRDGLSTPLEGNTINVAGANSRYNSTASGSYGGQPIMLKLFRDNSPAADNAYTTLTRQTKGFLIIRRFGGATGTSGDAFVAAQKVEIWPIEVLERAMMDIALDEPQAFTVKMAVPNEPNENATVS